MPIAHRLVLVLVLVLGLAPTALRAGGPPFSHMTLNGIEQLAIVVDDIEPELAVYGMTAAKVASEARDRLAAAGIALVDGAGAIEAPRAGQLRIRVLTNKDSHGFYHLGVKLEVRQKIPLGNPAGGFVSQIVWTSGDNGVMPPSETGRIVRILARLIDELIADYRAQNA